MNSCCIHVTDPSPPGTSWCSEAEIFSDLKQRNSKHAQNHKDPLLLHWFLSSETLVGILRQTRVHTIWEWLMNCQSYALTLLWEQLFKIGCHCILQVQNSHWRLFWVREHQCPPCTLKSLPASQWGYLLSSAPVVYPVLPSAPMVSGSGLTACIECLHQAGK